MFSDIKKIDIITTKSSWYLPHANALCEKILKLGCNAQIFYSPEKCRNGSLRFFLSYPKIVPLKYIKTSDSSFVVHASNLPEGKGFSPWVWQVLDGKHIIPIVLFKMEEELDSGDIFCKSYLELNGYELLHEIRQLLAIKTEEIVLNFIKNKDIIKPHKQVGKATFYKKRTAADSELDVSSSIQEQFNILRVVDNDRYPAFFVLNGHKYTLKIEKND